MSLRLLIRCGREVDLPVRNIGRRAVSYICRTDQLEAVCRVIRRIEEPRIEVVPLHVIPFAQVIRRGSRADGSSVVDHRAISGSACGCQYPPQRLYCLAYVEIY